MSRIGEREAAMLAGEAIDRGAMQHERELAALVLELERRFALGWPGADGAQELRHVLEIGTADGGTLWLWSQLALLNASLVAVDRDITERQRERCYSYRRAEQRMVIYPADSHELDTLERVRAYCGVRLNLLYLDGDHTHAGVQSDFYDYGALVVPGGVIVLHDTALEGVGRFVRELVDAGEESTGYAIAELKREPDPTDPQRERAGVPGDQWGGFAIATKLEHAGGA